MFDCEKTEREEAEFIISNENLRDSIKILETRIKEKGENAGFYSYFSKAYPYSFG